MDNIDFEISGLLAFFWRDNLAVSWLTLLLADASAWARWGECVVAALLFAPAEKTVSYMSIPDEGNRPVILQLPGYR